MPSTDTHRDDDELAVQHVEERNVSLLKHPAVLELVSHPWGGVRPTIMHVLQAERWVHKKAPGTKFVLREALAELGKSLHPVVAALCVDVLAKVGRLRLYYSFGSMTQEFASPLTAIPVANAQHGGHVMPCYEVR